MMTEDRERLVLSFFTGWLGRLYENVEYAGMREMQSPEAERGAYNAQTKGYR